MTDPMLPVGQKMRRTSADGYEAEAEVEASGPDWAIIRTVAAVQANTATLRLRPPATDSGAIRDENGYHWVPVTEPATWDVTRRPASSGEVCLTPTGHPHRWPAVLISADDLPDHIDADDLAHIIGYVLENWMPDVGGSPLAAVHRAAQTERETT